MFRSATQPIAIPKSSDPQRMLVGLSQQHHLRQGGSWHPNDPVALIGSAFNGVAGLNVDPIGPPLSQELVLKCCRHSSKEGEGRGRSWRFDLQVLFDKCSSPDLQQGLGLSWRRRPCHASQEHPATLHVLSKETCSTTARTGAFVSTVHSAGYSSL